MSTKKTKVITADRLYSSWQGIVDDNTSFGNSKLNLPGNRPLKQKPCQNLVPLPLAALYLEPHLLLITTMLVP